MNLLCSEFDGLSFRIISIVVFIPYTTFATNYVSVTVSDCGKSTRQVSSSTGEGAAYNNTFPGTTVGAGVIDQSINGLLHIVSATCKQDQKSDQSDVPDGEWIAVIYIPLLDDVTAETSSNKQKQQCSILDMVKAAMLLGASAAVLITMEPKWTAKLDAWNKLKFPVVTIHKNSATNMVSAIKRSEKKRKLWITIQHKEIKEEKQILNFGTVIEGSKCVWMGGVDANSIGWRSIVCKGGNYTINKVSANNILSLALSIIGGIILIQIMKGKTQNMENQIGFDDVEEALLRLARTAIMKMPTRKYKRRRHHQEKNTECAVCLEKFLPNQLVRVLPCYHSFHCKCVDSWLLKRRTCPLCKLNIVEHQISSSSLGNHQDL